MPRSPLIVNRWRPLTLLLAFAVFVSLMLVEAGAQGKRSQLQQNTATGSSPPQARRKNIASVRNVDTPDGARVSITSDAPLNDYEAYWGGDRFFVVIPNAELSSQNSQTLQTTLRGQGYQDVRIERRGNDLVFSFRMLAGMRARPEQKFNRLDIIFTAPPGVVFDTNTNRNGGGGGGQTSRNGGGGGTGTRQGNTSSNTNRGGGGTGTTGGGGTSSTGGGGGGTSTASTGGGGGSTGGGGGGTGSGARSTGSRSGRRGSGYGSYSGGGDRGGGGVPLNIPLPSDIQTTATPSPTAGATPTASPDTGAGTATTVPTPPATSSPSPGNEIAQNQPPAPVTAPPATSSTTTTAPAPAPAASSTGFAAAVKENWLPLLIGLLVLAAIVLLVASRSRADRAEERETERLQPKKQETIKEKPASSRTGAALAGGAAGAAAVAAMSKESGAKATAPAKETPKTEAATTEEVKTIEPVAPAVGMERIGAEVKSLLDGKDYDEAVVGSMNADTRQIVSTELLAALASRNPERRLRAREAFTKHGFFDEATQKLRTSTTPAERISAARALGLAQAQAGTPHLVAALEDDDPEVRRAAVNALAELRDPSAIGPLNALLEREKNRKVPHSLIRRAIESSATIDLPETTAATTESSTATTPTAPDADKKDKDDDDREVFEI